MASYQTLSDQVNVCPAKPNSARQNLLYIISGNILEKNGCLNYFILNHKHHNYVQLTFTLGLLPIGVVDSTSPSGVTYPLPGITTENTCSIAWSGVIRVTVLMLR